MDEDIPGRLLRIPQWKCTDLLHVDSHIVYCDDTIDTVASRNMLYSARASLRDTDVYNMHVTSARTDVVAFCRQHRRWQKGV